MSEFSHINIRKASARNAAQIVKELHPELPPRPSPELSLDESQRRVVETPSRLLRVLAPAGAGKTVALVRRAIKITRDDARARVLMLTFTNAGVAAFKRQLDEDAPGYADSRVVASTLNSHGLRLMGEQGVREPSRKQILYLLQPHVAAHFRRTLTAADRGTAYWLWQAMERTKEMGFSPSDPDSDADIRGLLAGTSCVSVLLGMLEKSEVRGRRWTEDDVFGTWLGLWREVVDAASPRWLTFADQKFRAFWRLHAGDPVVVSNVMRGGFTHLFIDEFQDTNLLELFLVTSLVQVTGGALCQSGDDDQCIYQFKGCSPRFILRPDLYAEALLDAPERATETIILERNYRCPPNITRYSVALIDHNQHRELKAIQVYEHEENPDACVRVVHLSASVVAMQVAVDLARLVLADLARVIASGAKLKDRKQPLFGILARTNAQLVPIQILLTREEIPHFIPEKKNLFLGDALKALEAAFHLRAHADDNLRQAIPAGELMSCHECVLLLANAWWHDGLSKKQDADLRKALAGHRSPADAVDVVALALGGQKWTTRLQDALRALLDVAGAFGVLHVLFERFQGFARDYGMDVEDIFKKDPPCGLFLDLAMLYESEAEFLADLIQTRHRAKDMSTNHALTTHDVHLLTAHAAKGLQFSTVIVLDANEGFWPHANAEAAELEAERRLFYVAMTRARSNLLLFASSTLQGRDIRLSRFIDEAGIPEREHLHCELAPALLEELRALYPLERLRRR